MEQIKSIEAARARDQNMSQGAPDVSFFYPFFILIFKNHGFHQVISGTETTTGWPTASKSIPTTVSGKVIQIRYF